MFCSAPFAACCFVRRSVRKDWACGVLFDVVFGFRVLFGVSFGKVCLVGREVWRGAFSLARCVLFSILLGMQCFVRRFVRTS